MSFTHTFSCKSEGSCPHLLPGRPTRALVAVELDEDVRDAAVRERRGHARANDEDRPAAGPEPGIWVLFIVAVVLLGALEFRRCCRLFYPALGKGREAVGSSRLEVSRRPNDLNRETIGKASYA